VMDHLELRTAAIVGWSDGGVTALDLAIHHPTRIAKVFVLGTNYDARGSKARKARRGDPFSRYAKKCRADHARLAASPKAFDAMLAAMRPGWRSNGTIRREQLRAIQVPALISIGEHDEIIQLAQIQEMARLIPAGQLQIFRRTSHFTLWQDPTAFNATLV